MNPRTKEQNDYFRNEVGGKDKWLTAWISMKIENGLSEIKTKMEALEAVKVIRDYIPANELNVMINNMRGPEKQHFFNKAVEIADIIKNMPVTYGQDGKGKNAVAYLHYFHGEADWYITEKDKEPEQIQAFGMADLGCGGELGYISIVELLENNIELDLYFTPKTLGDIEGGN